jgi:hypothetical protein
VKSQGLLLLYFVSVPPAWGDSRPAWTESAASSDSTYKVYVGRAVDAPSDSEAVFQATVNARKQAISENFGTWVQIESNAYRASDAGGSRTSLGQSSTEISSEVRLIEFEQTALHFEREDKKVNAWVRFKYPRSEIERERTRLKRLDTGDSAPSRLMKFSTGETGAAGGVLEIHSRPAGLPVEIDTNSELLGRKLKTPLEIRGIAVGRHIIKINDPRFALHAEEVQIHPGSQQVIRAIMKPAFGTLRVESSLERSTVTIGSKTYLTPVKEIEIPAGVKLTIEVSHPEADSPVRDEIELSRNDRLEKSFDLKLKPVLVSVNTSPEGAEVFDESHTSLGKTPLTANLRAREVQSLRFEKHGFDSKLYEVPSSPGGSTHLVRKPVILSRAAPKPTPGPTPEPEPDHSSSLSNAPQARYLWMGFRIGQDGRSIREADSRSFYFGFNGEWEWNRWMGFDFGGDFGIPSANSGSGSSSDRGSKLRGNIGMVVHTPFIKRVRVFAGAQAFWHEFDDPVHKLNFRMRGQAWKGGIDWIFLLPSEVPNSGLRLEFNLMRPDHIEGRGVSFTHFIDVSLSWMWGF